MKQVQFYKYATWFLLVLNIALITFFVLTKPKPPHNGEGADFAQKAIHILKLDEQQNAGFRESAKQHNQQMEEINKQQKELLKPYFYGLIDSANIINSDALLSKTQQLERNKIELTYKHFEEVKSLLKEKQMPDFDKFMHGALKVILFEEPRGPHPPKTE